MRRYVLCLLAAASLLGGCYSNPSTGRRQLILFSASEVSAMGVEAKPQMIAEFGGDSFVVDALPACVAAAAPSSLLADVARALEQAGTRQATGRWREEAIAGVACKAAVKANDRLTLEEIERLVVDLAGAEMPYTCPHGRPTLIYSSFKELNRKFGRE